MSVSLYTPVGKVVKREFDLSPRVASLDGLVVGLLSRGSTLGVLAGVAAAIVTEMVRERRGAAR